MEEEVGIKGNILHFTTNKCGVKAWYAISRYEYHATGKSNSF